MYCPLHVSRCANSISVRYPFTGPSSAVVSKTVSTALSITTIVPLEDGVLGLPRLTGIVRTTLPASTTVIFLVALSTFITKLRPIFAVAARSRATDRPGAGGSAPNGGHTGEFVRGPA